MKTAKSKPAASTYTVPSAIQAFFVVVTMGSFLAMMVQLTAASVQQYANNPSGGGLYGFYVSTIVLPALLFLVAYAMNPRKLALVQRTFESLLLTVATLTVWTLFSLVNPAVFIGNPENNYIELFATYQILSSGVLVALYTGVLYWLRRTKRWA